MVDAEYSLGLLLEADGTVGDSVVTMPAYKAGIAPGMKIIGVNGRAFDKDVFTDALKASSTSSGPMQFLVLNDGYYKTISIDYHGGPRYPHLERAEGKPDLLGEIMKPLAKQ
jgi:predicted metalloprotease with PDZ domain